MLCNFSFNDAFIQILNSTEFRYTYTSYNTVDMTMLFLNRYLDFSCNLTSRGVLVSGGEGWVRVTSDIFENVAGVII